MAAPDDEKYSVGRSGSRDFLSMLIQMHRANPEVVTTRDVFGSCMTNIGAGSDTTSISLTGILYYLHTHQGALRKVHKPTLNFQLHAKPGIDRTNIDEQNANTDVCPSRSSAKNSTPPL